MRRFETGATRDSEEGKIDPEGFLSPEVLLEFSQYMHKHRVQADGSLRDSDNWQKGIPQDAYMKSLWRHFLDLWLLHRNKEGAREEIEDAVAGVFFNIQGYWFEHIKRRPPAGRA